MISHEAKGRAEDCDADQGHRHDSHVDQIGFFFRFEDSFVLEAHDPELQVDREEDHDEATAEEANETEDILGACLAFLPGFTCQVFDLLPC